MVWFRRLRFRLIAIQLLVVLTGVLVMLLATQYIMRRAPTVIRPTLITFLDAETLPVVEQALLLAFRNAVLLAVGLAAAGAVAAGAVASLLLWRTLVAPLRDIASSSQRIAGGRYDERVAIPQHSGDAVQRLATNFNQMAQALQQIEQKRVAMIGNVAHELRTPLTGLRGIIEGMEDGVFASDNETFGMISREINRLSRLVDDIQHLSRVEAGAVPLDLRAFDLCAVVEHVARGWQPQAVANQVDMQVICAPELAPVVADSDRTAQIITNLVANAIRYTSAGGSIKITLGRTGLYAQVLVQDSGIGIDAADLPYIFERFYRVDRSRAQHGGGSGVGLTISRQLAWAMNGTLSASSSGLGAGTVFTLTLPLAADVVR